MTNWTERLLEAIDRLTSHGDSPNGPGHRLILTVDVDELERLAAEARTALAQPEPEGVGDVQIMELMPQQLQRDLATVSRLAAHGAGPDVGPGLFRVSLNTGIIEHCRAVLTRYARPAIEPVPMTDYRAELQRLLGAVENDVIDTNDGLRFQAAVNRARAALAQPEPEGPTDEEKWYPGFADWLEREMPEGTVIGDPLWWASKIADYLQRHGRPAIEPVPGAEVDHG